MMVSFEECNGQIGSYKVKRGSVGVCVCVFSIVKRIRRNNTPIYRNVSTCFIEFAFPMSQIGYIVFKYPQRIKTICLSTVDIQSKRSTRKMSVETPNAWLFIYRKDVIKTTFLCSISPVTFLSLYIRSERVICSYSQRIIYDVGMPCYLTIDKHINMDFV